MTLWNYITLFVICWQTLIILNLMPDKKTRKRIQEIAEETKLPYHIVHNEILKDFFNNRENEIIVKISSNPKELTFEEWKKQQEGES